MTTPRVDPCLLGGLAARPEAGYVRICISTSANSTLRARPLGVKTEPKPLTPALDAIGVRQEISWGMRRLRAAGGLRTSNRTSSGALGPKLKRWARKTFSIRIYTSMLIRNPLRSRPVEVF